MVYSDSAAYLTCYLYPFSSQVKQEKFSKWQNIYIIPGYFSELYLPRFDGVCAKLFYVGNGNCSLAFSTGENSIDICNIYAGPTLNRVSFQTTGQYSVLIPNMYTLIDFDFYHNNVGTFYSLLVRVSIKNSSSPNSIFLLMTNGKIVVLPGKINNNNGYGISLDKVAIFGNTACK